MKYTTTLNAMFSFDDRKKTSDIKGQPEISRSNFCNIIIAELKKKLTICDQFDQVSLSAYMYKSDIKHFEKLLNLKPQSTKYSDNGLYYTTFIFNVEKLF